MATKWGIISAGKISHDFVTAVQSISEPEHEFVAVAARSLKSAQSFAESHNIPKAYGSYEELAKDKQIEVAYIGSVNNAHFELGKCMLENGKHVLMEKPMTLNVKQTKALIDLAKKKNLFLMEAVWSRFNPAYRYVMDLLQKGTIGNLVHVDAKFGIPALGIERLMKNELGGGTILDLGIYPINFVTMMYNGDKPTKIASVGHLNEDGVDIAMSTSLSYSNNRTASISTNAITELPNEAIITGTKGYIKVCQPFWCPETIVVNGKQIEFPLPETIRPCNFTNSSGLRYEAIEVRECLKKGALESSILPLKDSITMGEIMDEIRRQLGVKFSSDS